MICLVICERCCAVLNGLAHMDDDDFLASLVAAATRSEAEAEEHWREFEVERRADHELRCPAR